MYTTIWKGSPWHIQAKTVPLCIILRFLGKRGRTLRKISPWIVIKLFSSLLIKKYCRANLVSFMLVKVPEWPSSQYRFNLFWPDWTTNGKEVSHPPKDGRALLCILLSFFEHRRLPMKKSPQWSLLHAFRLSKIESTIEHLPSRAHQKSTRSYHNGVSRHHPTDNSLEAFPHWVSFV